MHPVMKLQNTQNKKKWQLKGETNPQLQLETPLSVADIIRRQNGNEDKNNIVKTPWPKQYL